MTIENEKIAEALTEIQKSSNAMMIIITEIKGDNKLQSQVLNYHIEQLKSFKEDIEVLTKDLHVRVTKLEQWQIKIALILSVGIGVFALFAEQIREAIFK